MKTQRAMILLLPLLVTALSLAGCGAARQVTYVDPNEPDAGIAGVSGGESPFERFGGAVAERAKAVVRVRAALAAARTLAASDTAAASSIIDRSIEEDLVVIEPRVAASDAALSARLRGSLERLRDNPPATAPAYNIEVRRIADQVLGRAGELAVPVEARQDIAFRGAVLYETLLHAATSYEAAFDGSSTTITNLDEYRTSYGLLIDAVTRQLETVPENARPAIKARLDRIARRSLPGPVPPSQPKNPEAVLGELTLVADDAIQASGVDPTYPQPDPVTPDQLRSLKREVAAAIETWKRGDSAAASQLLSDADRAFLVPASAGVAAVSPELVAQLEYDLLVDLPAAMRSKKDVDAFAVDLDSRLDEAIALVEDELELLREAA